MITLSDLQTTDLLAVLNLPQLHVILQLQVILFQLTELSL